MTNPHLTQVASLLRSTFDRKTAGGVFIGVAIMATALATAQTSGSTGMFSGLLSSGTAGSGTSLISQQDSVVAASIKAESEKCAEEGIGAAIQTAMQVHTEMASVPARVDPLFDVNRDCFSSVRQIFDLSNAIPSLASILAAAQAALLQYAQKKVCTAVKDASSIVTAPINEAIGNFNQIQRFTDVKGMANTMVTTLDQQLSNKYRGGSTPSASSYTVNTNPFNSTQTTFDSSISTNTGLNNNTTQINLLTQQIADQQIKINKDQMTVQTAQSNYSNCSGGWDTDCSSAFAALQQAQQQLAADQATLITLQTQMSSVVTQGGSVMSPSVGTQTVTTGTTSTPSTTTSGSSWWSGLSSVLN